MAKRGGKAKKGDVLDVAIVGGGVGGVYSGWRLLTQGGAKTVAVFEGSERIGGRLLSAEPPGLPKMHAELGGMRMLNNQKRIARLVKELDVATYPFPVDAPTNIAYLRGVHLRESQFTADPYRVPYRLGFLERGQAVGNIVVGAIEQIVPGITALSPTERLEAVKTARFAGKPLYQQGFWQVLRRVISNEAYELSVDAGGYQSTLTSWNAADAVPWYLADFGVGSEYFGFRDGYQQVPLRLAKLLTKAGGSVEKGAWLRSFDVDDDGLVSLRFRDRAEPVKAKSLILAMPRRSLELLEPRGAVLSKRNKRVWSLLGSVTPRPLFKLFTAYRDPWWLAAGVEKGRTVTDMPVRQTYYWPNGDGSPRKKGPALLMASYDDGGAIGFWDAFRPKRGAARLSARERAAFAFERFVGEGEAGSAGVSPAPSREATAEWDAHPAPLAMVEEIQRQLGAIHGLEFVPQPYSAAFMDWGDDPWGGGWNSWNIGVKSWEVEKAVQQPVPGLPVYVVGEAYSRDQGWVEGALDTADQVLHDHFHVPPIA